MSRVPVSLQVGSSTESFIVLDDGGNYIEDICDVWLHIGSDTNGLVGYYLQYVTDDDGNYLKNRRAWKTRKVTFYVTHLVNGLKPYK